MSLQLLLVDAFEEALDFIVSENVRVKLVNDAVDGVCATQLLENGWWTMLFVVVRGDASI